MNSTEQLKLWVHLVSEAVEGSVDLEKNIRQNLIKYGREASQFDLPKDYPSIKSAADVLATLDQLIKASKEQIEDPMALSLLSRIKNTNPLSISRQLDSLAKAENPEKP
jgi:hypothetical protein